MKFKSRPRQAKIRIVSNILMLFYASNVANAARELATFPVTASSSQYQRSAVTGLGSDANATDLNSLIAQSNRFMAGSTAGTGTVASGEITLTNLGVDSQTVTISISDEQISASVCTGETITGWGGVSNCWHSLNIPYPNSDHTLAPVSIPAGGSMRIPWIWACRFSRTGPDCGIAVDAASTNSCDFTLNGLNIEYKLRLKVRVEEDRGAVLGSAFVKMTISNAASQRNQDVNMPLNGGRPF